MRLVNIGYGNVVVAERVVAVISPESAPMKRFKEEARKAGRLIDGTQGRRTRSILITDSHHIVLSALQTETLAERLERGSMTASPNPSAPAPTLLAEDSPAGEGVSARGGEEADEAEGGGQEDAAREDPGS
ncbi:MAG: DUF370 domain-containing protein [Myxococcales bacterium]|nr:DUF370 domain-containing protein [Myxococcales bacterium]